MPEQDIDTPILDLLAKMTADSIEAADLDAEQLMLVRIAALVAMDAPPVSYVFNLEAAGDVNIGPDEIQSIFAAIAPIVGTARIASAASNITRALGIVLDLAELEAEEEANA